MEYHDAYPVWASALCSNNPTENSSAIRAHSMVSDNRRILRPPPNEVACTTIREGSKDAEHFVCRSYTLRAIFRPWKPTGPNRYSLKGWILGPSRFSCPYSPECVEGEFSEVGLLTDSCWIHRCWLGCERGRALSRGSFPFPSGCSLPLPLFVHHPRRMRVLRTSHCRSSKKIANDL